MQRTSTPLNYRLWKQPYAKQVLLTAVFGNNASIGGIGRARLASSSSSSSTRWPGAPAPRRGSTAERDMSRQKEPPQSKQQTKHASEIEAPSAFGAPAPREKSQSAIAYVKADSNMPRRFTREENMWRVNKNKDSFWLNPRDPTRYKPNFEHVEPESLRKQFMRSLDQRTRDVLGKDWEKAVKVAAKEAAVKARAAQEAAKAEATTQADGSGAAQQSKPHPRRRLDPAQLSAQKASAARREMQWQSRARTSEDKE
ncbi:uncharacterized protein LOC115629370 [Scaptodrosophila lebanonensis]|uniref:Uncharacterized protein LOC115629370 n=1 Tax=Drosophila lebanonensis TaxID=7225 RepID=A0A6J2U2H8_DROLE|nr:uncharacterized protein LOC115629370 [Scaptodrosophila lebanonensis]